MRVYLRENSSAEAIHDIKRVKVVGGCLDRVREAGARGRGQAGVDGTKFLGGVDDHTVAARHGHLRGSQRTSLAAGALGGIVAPRGTSILFQ